MSRKGVAGRLSNEVQSSPLLPLLLEGVQKGKIGMPKKSRMAEALLRRDSELNRLVYLSPIFFKSEK